MKKIIRKEIYEEVRKNTPRRTIWVNSGLRLSNKSIVTEINGLTLEDAINVLTHNYEKAAQKLGVPVAQIAIKKDRNGYNTYYGYWREETDEEYDDRIDRGTDLKVHRLRQERDWKRRELKRKKAQLEQLKKELGE